MSKPTQRRVLAAIKEQVEYAEFEFIDDPAWANTGYISACGKDEVVSPRRLQYAFNDTYCTFTAELPRGQTNIQGVNSWYHNVYIDQEGMYKTINAAAEWLTGR